MTHQPEPSTPKASARVGMMPGDAAPRRALADRGDATGRTDVRADDGLAWVVFDIDGTVSDSRHRQAYVDRAVPDWEAFFAAAGADAPLVEGVDYALRRAQNGHLLWLTGRPERYRDMTVAWLNARGLPTAHVHMRPDDDMRPAVVFKAERVQHIAAARPILLIVDDDEQVVRALRAAGWPVEHARWTSA